MSWLENFMIEYFFQAHPFHLVSPSPWPLLSSVSLLATTTTGVMSMHGFSHASVFFFTSLFSVVYSMSLWFRDIISEATYLGNHTLAVLEDLIINIYHILLWFRDIIKEVMLFLSVSGPSLLIIISILSSYLLILVEGLLTLLYIVIAYNNRKEIINYISECLYFFLNCFVWLIKFIIHCPHQAILLLQIICCLLNLSIAITNIGLWSFAYSSLIINNMDINTVCKFSSDYNFLTSQDTIFTSVISINPGLALNDFAFSGYSEDIFSDYLLMDGNISGDTSSASYMANSNNSYLANLPSGGSNTGNSVVLTPFDHFVSNLEPGVVPSANELMPYLFEDELSIYIDRLAYARASIIAEDNPWINQAELANVKQNFSLDLKNSYDTYMLSHEQGISPPSNPAPSMQALKNSVILSACVEQLNNTYSYHSPLGDLAIVQRPVIDGKYELNLVRSLYDQVSKISSGSPLDPLNQAIADNLRTTAGLNSHPGIPPRSSRIALIDSLNEKIFFGTPENSAFFNRDATINRSAILQEVYKHQPVFR